MAAGRTQADLKCFTVPDGVLFAMICLVAMMPVLPAIKWGLLESHLTERFQVVQGLFGWMGFSVLGQRHGCPLVDIMVGARMIALIPKM